MSVQSNSFISLVEDISMLNKNVVEIMTSLNTVISASDASVQFTLYEEDGTQSTFNMPTVGYLKTQIDKLNNDVKRLSGFEEGTSLIVDGKSIKRIFTTDLNNEPNPISDISQVRFFETVNNHFFEGLINPMLAINIDLTNKVNDDTNAVLSRRYIVKFERNNDNSLTANGTQSYNDFRTKFLNRDDIAMSEFVDWYNSPTNYGVVVDVVEPYDEQVFDLTLKTLEYHGIFSVIRTETDAINKKFWYHLDTLTYYGINGETKTLAVDDEIILNKLESSTRWKVKEVSVDSSYNRVILERVSGFDPVPIGTNVLKYYSDMSAQKSVKITIGFDEHVVIFVKPINTQNNLVSNVWSKGTCFYTNNLMLSSNQNVRLSEYYLKSVYDYGKILDDMVLKKIPSKYGVVPNAVVLDAQNFKVVQINKHLTDSKDADTLKNLQSQKITSKTKLAEYESAIIIKNRELNSDVSQTDRIRISNELRTIYDNQDAETKNLNSIVSKISSITNTSKVEPKFRIRGFWAIPEPIISSQTEPQHVVQFRVQYRYSAKNGRSTSVESFQFNQPNANRTNEQQINSELTNVSSTSETIDRSTAYYSNWNEFKTDARKRYWDEVQGAWYWKLEDVSDADTPNINQMDIPIQENERVEIRIKSISEVGWPDTLLESDWSDVLVVVFPDDLTNVLAENQFILKEATVDNSIVQMNGELNAKGVFQHIRDSYYIGETYYTHTDRSISSSFPDENGNTRTIYEYLTYLTNKINDLELIINKAKGELRVVLNWVDSDGNNINRDINNNDVIPIIIECEDYYTKYTGTGPTTSRAYENLLYKNIDYYITIESKNTNPIGLLSSRLYTTGGTYNNTFYTTTKNKAIVVDQNEGLFTQQNNQYIWFSDNSNNLNIYSAATSSLQQLSVLQSAFYNIGCSGQTDTNSPFTYVKDLSVYTNGGVNYEWATNNTQLSGFCTSIFPSVNQMTDLIETGQAKSRTVDNNNKVKIGISMYFKYNPIYTTTWFEIKSNSTYQEHTKKLKIFMDYENSVRPIEFELQIKLRNYKKYAQVRSNISTSTSRSR